MFSGMYDIDSSPPSVEFLECWAAAGRHLDLRSEGAQHFWLKVDPVPPFLDHLSFRVGNQLFFVRIEDVDDGISVPGNRGGLRMIAQGCRGHACLMPMRRGPDGWRPAADGWGLLDIDRGTTIDPPGLVTDLPVEMTGWELQDFAVQVVQTHIRDAGHHLISWQGNPSVDPSIWYAGPEGLTWVIVRGVRFPAPRARAPDNWPAIAERCARLGGIGEFASVAVANSATSFNAPARARPLPLLRGYPLDTCLHGIERLTELRPTKLHA